ncbi:MAG: serine hydrolase domain-containing protein [Spirillospora sp.]
MLGSLAAVPLAAAHSDISLPKKTPSALRPGGEYDRFIADLAAAGTFSGAVLLAHRGRPVLQRAHGMADRKRRVPNRTDTRFDLASITKTFTAVACAQLAEQRKLAFTDTIGAHLDGYPAEIAGTATVQQLLTHTSGVGRPGRGGEGPPDAADWDSVDKVWNGNAAYIRGLPLRFTPGTKYAYSNDGFFVLGEIVAKTSTHTSYYDHVASRIFRQARMGGSGFFTRRDVLSDQRIAHPYAKMPSGEVVDVATDKNFPFVGTPYRGAYSTVHDLLAYTRALTTGKLLGPAYVHVITSGKTVVDPRPEPATPTPSSTPPVTSTGAPLKLYGFGFGDEVVNGHRVFGHSGSGPGAANQLDVFPDLGWTSIILANQSDPIDPIVTKVRQLITHASR